MARVVVFDEFGGADVLSIVDGPTGEPRAAELCLKIEAFEINRLDLPTGALQPTVDRVFPFGDIADAHRHLEQGQQMGKVVVARLLASAA